MADLGFTRRTVNIRRDGLPAASSSMFQTAANMTEGIRGFRTPTVTGARMTAATMRNPTNVQAGQLSRTNLSPYMNPYTQNVIDTSMADMQRANQMAINDVGAAATAAGAFGGSRHGLVESQTNADFVRNAGAMASGLRQDAFTNAQQMAVGDIDRRFDAGQFNVSNDMAANQFNAAARNNARQFNADNRQQARLANQDARFRRQDLRMNAANQMGNMANLGFGMGRQITQDQMGVGNQQQQLLQSILDGGKQQFRGFTGQGQSGLATLLSALGGVPVPQSTTSTQTPGLLNIASTLLGL